MITGFEVIFQPEGKRVRVSSNSTILDAAKIANVDLTFVCGGLGKCGKCKVIVENSGDNVNPLTSVERRFLSESEISSGYRLACQTIVKGSLIINIPEGSRTGKQRLQVEGIETPVKPEPNIRKYFVELPKPSLQDVRSDADRLLDGLRQVYGLENLMISYDVLQHLPLVLREGEWKVTAVIWDGRVIIDVEPGNTAKRVFGCAFDIGTTKIAGYLLDLNYGAVLAVDSLMNPQIPYGEDVISRITYASMGLNELRELQKAAIDGVNQILKSLLDKTGVSFKEIYEMTIVGNTVMHHLFLGICPKYIALAPYPPVVRGGLNVKAREIGVEINENGNIHLLPVIGGFVGADTVAVILATELYKREDLCMALDIGTNTEVVLGNKNGILACSCASGPAFEGAHIKCGMRAASGAIEKVKLDPETLEVKYQTIDGVKPRGICGSALVDAVAEMLKAGIIDISGAFNKNISSSRIRKGDDGYEFILAWGSETATGEEIVITQRDIREIQLAKAAIHTGCAVLMRKMNVEESDISVLFIAGAFGSYINPESARTIGMYPEIPLNKVCIVGNAAGTGARMALISKSIREKAEEISRRVRYIELGAEPEFQAEFLNSHFMPHADLTIYPETVKMLKQLGRQVKKPTIILNTRKINKDR
ncbi:MAG: ASKHA domain-containing protein [Candidatus Bathyarchaeia archaeon]